MIYKITLLMAIFGFGLFGCVHMATDRYLDRQCTRSHVECPGRKVVERKAQKMDMASFRAIGDFISDDDSERSVAPPYHDSSEPLCPDNQKKVCSASAGCRCEPR